MKLREKRERPADPRPYIGDSGRAVEGALDAATVAGGMVLLAFFSLDGIV